MATATFATAEPGAAAPPAVPPGVDPEVELAKVRSNPAYFITTYGVIDNKTDRGDDPDGTEVFTTPFKLWPSQIPVVLSLWTQKLLVILKARQLGISWLVCAYVLWVSLFRPGRLCMLFSKGQRESNELIRRVKVLHERLPEWLRVLVPRLTVDNVRELGWSNASVVRAMPATRSAGVSFTVDVMVMDEAAHMLWADQLYTNASPAAADGQIIVLSTANGLGGFFHNLWTRAVGGTNRFRTIFLPWWARPGRDAAWYAARLAESNEPAKHPQNYPADPLEAFVASGRLRFDRAWVTRQGVNLRDPIPPASWPAGLRVRRGWTGLGPMDLPLLWDVPGLKVFKAPEPGRSYAVAADVAEGKDPDGRNDSDFDAAVVFDRETGEQAAELHGRWEPDVFALYLMALSEPYHQAPVVVERNNHGHSVLVALKLHHFPVDRVALGHDGWPGWLTSEATKQPGVDLLAKALRLGLIVVRSLASMTEIQVYTVLKNGRTGAPSGYHDDLVMAWVVGLSWLASPMADVNRGGVPVAAGEAPSYTGRLL